MVVCFDMDLPTEEGRACMDTSAVDLKSNKNYVKKEVKRGYRRISPHNLVCDLGFAHVPRDVWI
jgi:hypothetical protein